MGSYSVLLGISPSPSFPKFGPQDMLGNKQSSLSKLDLYHKSSFCFEEEMLTPEAV